MCGRLWQTLALNFLIKHANAAHVHNHQNYSGGTYNMGPTNFIPAIRRRTANLGNIQRAQQVLEEVEQQKKLLEEQKQFESQSQSQSLAEQPPSQQRAELAELADKELEALDDNRVLDFMKWGYNTKFNLVINVRMEDCHDKAMFKPFLNKNRCIAMALGYYEWDSKKNPHLFRRKEQVPEPVIVSSLTLI